MKLNLFVSLLTLVSFECNADIDVKKSAGDLSKDYKNETLWKMASPDQVINLMGQAKPIRLALENALTFNSPLSRSTNTISIPAASTSVSGHLTSTDWNTFNGKVGGSGTTNQFAYFSGSGTLTSSATYRISSGNFSVATNVDVNTTSAFQGFRRIMSGLAHGVTNKLPTDMAWGFTDYSSTSYPNL